MCPSCLCVQVSSSCKYSSQIALGPPEKPQCTWIKLFKGRISSIVPFEVVGVRNSIYESVNLSSFSGTTDFFPLTRDPQVWKDLSLASASSQGQPSPQVCCPWVQHIVGFPPAHNLGKGADGGGWDRERPQGAQIYPIPIRMGWGSGAHQPVIECFRLQVRECPANSGLSSKDIQLSDVTGTNPELTQCLKQYHQELRFHPSSLLLPLSMLCFFKLQTCDLLDRK